MAGLDCRCGRLARTRAESRTDALVRSERDAARGTQNLVRLADRQRCQQAPSRAARVRGGGKARAALVRIGLLLVGEVGLDLEKFRFSATQGM